MATVILHAGEALRIDAGTRRVLILQTPGGYEIRHGRAGLFERLAARWRAHRDSVELQALDPRTLRDIGLEQHAVRVAERRRLESYWQRLAGFY